MVCPSPSEQHILNLLQTLLMEHSLCSTVLSFWQPPGAEDLCTQVPRAKGLSARAWAGAGAVGAAREPRVACPWALHVRGRCTVRLLSESRAEACDFML